MLKRGAIYFLSAFTIAWVVYSTEVTKQDSTLKLYHVGEVNKSVMQKVAVDDDGSRSIVVLDTNMSSDLRQSALSSLLHNSQVYNDPASVLWYSSEEMNAKHPYYLWLGAVNYEYLIGTGPYMSVSIDGHHIFMFGVVRC